MLPKIVDFRTHIRRQRLGTIDSIGSRMKTESNGLESLKQNKKNGQNEQKHENTIDINAENTHMC